MDKELKEDQLFSIDIEAYLHKVALFTQRSALLYPAELTKTAFSRGADKADLIIDRNRVEIADNGEGIDPAKLNMLAELKIKDLPVERKEFALRSLRGDHGPGLLSVFASEPKSIIIETVFNNRRYTLKINKEEVYLEEGCSIEKGTKIIIVRRSRAYKREIDIFREYSRWSGREIKLNGNEIISEQSIPDSIISAKVGEPGSEITGICGIPASGGMCRIWLTEKGIIREKRDIPPFRGLIFSAVVETDSLKLDEIYPKIVPYVQKLYFHLGENFLKLSSDHKERVEELIFLHTRETGEKKFVNAIKPFRIFGSDTFVGLEEIIKLSDSGKLFVINSDYKRSGMIVEEAQSTVEMSPRQIDFVFNHLHVRGRMVDSFRINKKRMISWILLKFELLKYRIASGTGLLKRKLEADQLWNEERDLLIRLNDHFRDYSMPNGKDYGKINFYVVKGPGISPLYFKVEGSGILNSELSIFLRRGSRIVRKIVKLNDKNVMNFELAVAFIETELILSQVLV